MNGKYDCSVNGGHDYEPRHDEVTNVEATTSANFWKMGSGTARIVDRLWVADVCSRCGHMIRRPIKDRRLEP